MVNVNNKRQFYFSHFFPLTVPKLSPNRDLKTKVRIIRTLNFVYRYTP